tara:strand:- start:208 stop:516 length:309 start_codon:yes stop_codon:yes gene_type:complete
MAEICKNCGLPKDLCVCEELDKDDLSILVKLELRKFRKPTTIIEGLNSKNHDLKKMTYNLKKKLACGGAIKDEIIIIQGDHRDLVKEYLVSEGFDESVIEVQ